MVWGNNTSKGDKVGKLALALLGIAIIAIVAVYGVVKPELESTRERRVQHESTMLNLEENEAIHWQEEHMPIVLIAKRYTVLFLLLSSIIASMGIAIGIAIRFYKWGYYSQEQQYQIKLANIRSTTIISCAQGDRLPKLDSNSTNFLNRLLIEGTSEEYDII